MPTPKQIYLAAEDGRPRDVLGAWRNEFQAAQREMQAYMAEIGANGAFSFGLEKPRAFRFPRDQQPDGWTKPRGRGGASRPRKDNAEGQARLDALPWPGSLQDVVRREFELPSDLTYRYHERNWGSRSLRGNAMHAFDLIWSGTGPDDPGTPILIAPNYEGEREEVEASAPGAAIEWGPEGATPEIPDGFRLLTEGEVDVIFAEAKRARERAAETGEPEAAPAP